MDRGPSGDSGGGVFAAAVGKSRLRQSGGRRLEAALDGRRGDRAALVEVAVGAVRQRQYAYALGQRVRHAGIVRVARRQRLRRRVRAGEVDPAWPAAADVDLLSARPVRTVQGEVAVHHGGGGNLLPAGVGDLEGEVVGDRILQLLIRAPPSRVLRRTPDQALDRDPDHVRPVVGARVDDVLRTGPHRQVRPGGRPLRGSLRLRPVPPRTRQGGGIEDAPMAAFLT